MSEEIIATVPNSRPRILHNVLFSSAGWFLPIIITIVATPIIVKHLGYEQYGIYALILGFVNYSFTFGVGRGVTKYVAEFRMRGEAESVNAIIWASIWFSLALCAVGTLVITLTAGKIVRDVLQIGDGYYRESVIALYMACASIGFLMLGQIFQAVLQAIHRFDRVSMLITLNGFLLTIGNIIIVLSGFGFLPLILWNLLLTAFNGLLFFSTAKKHLPEFKLDFRFDAAALRLILHYGSGVIAYQIFSNALVIFERSWITRSLGAENLTFYVVPMTLALYMHAFVSSVVLVIFPVISELQNDVTTLIKLYRKATKTVFAVVALIVLTLIASRHIFLTLWINRDFAEKSSQVLIFLTVAFSVFSVTSIVWQIAEGFGKPRYNAVVAFVWLAVSIPLMIILTGEYGGSGAAFARFAGNIVTVPFIFFAEKKFLGVVQLGFWFEILPKLLAAAAAAYLVQSLIFGYFPAVYLTFVGGAIAGCFVYAAILLAAKYFDREESAMFRSVLKIGE